MKKQTLLKNEQRKRRALRVRAKLLGTKECPRFSVFRSLRYLFAQAIDDSSGRTIVSLHSKKVNHIGKRVDIAFEFGKRFAGLLQKQGIEQIVFDRGHYAYHGRVKALASGLREGGVKF
jgi:large subunit ribosomal protein L18